MKATSRQPFEPKEFKGSRRQRRALARKMNERYRLYVFEVETFDGDYYYVVALNTDHVKEILLTIEPKIDDEQIFWIKPLNQQQMEQIEVDEQTNLYTKYLEYEGNGGVISSTAW